MTAMANATSASNSVDVASLTNFALKLFFRTAIGISFN